MTKIVDTNRIAEVVKRSISEALAVPADKVVPPARLISDLRAESIDVADVRFRIESGLSIRIDQREMTAAIGEGVSAEEFDTSFTVQFIIDYVTRQMVAEQ